MGEYARMWIGGRWLDGERAFEARSPSTGEVIGEVAEGSREDARRAIEAARAAQPGWASLSAFDRARAMRRVAEAIDARREELARILTLDQGKPLRAEAEDEVAELISYFEMASADATRAEGVLPPSIDAGKRVLLQRVPLGVVSVISPWNWPYTMPAEILAPAISYGNTVVWVPAPSTSICAAHLAECLEAADLPAGVVNLVTGPGPVVGDEIAANPGTQAVGFIGSIQTGHTVAARAAGKELLLEMGGNGPLVVLDDADLEVAVECAIQGAFFQTGQRCTASSRLIVTERIHDAFVGAMVEAMKRLRVGHALEEGTQVGPVVDEGQLKQDEDYLRIGLAEGAELAWGGERLQRETEGYFLQPALLIRTRNDMRVNREEIFGPIATVVKVGSAEEALAVANDTEYGLSAGVCTTSLRHAVRFRDGLQAGIVTVNLPTAGVDFHVPFGGTKGSSQGSREQGRYAVEFFTQVKTAYTRP